MPTGTARRTSKLIWILGGAIALSLACVVVLKVAFGGMCANEILATIPSPDGSHKAVVFERDCGATTGFSTQVSVLKSHESLANGGGNLFVADTDHGGAPSGPGGGPEVRVTWSGPHSLAIAYHSRARVFEKHSWTWGASASYSTFD